jgi:hypothetical protein
MLVEEKSKFVALYLEEPGRTAEVFGPDANEVRIAPIGGSLVYANLLSFKYTLELEGPMVSHE